MEKNSTFYVDDRGPFWDLIKMLQLTSFSVGSLYNTELFFDPDAAISYSSITRSQGFFQHVSEILYLKNITNAQDIVFSLGCLVLNQAYERIKQYKDGSEIFEFLYHVRNACSHNNRFIFRYDQPRGKASWKGITIDENLKGESNPLYGKECIGNILMTGDIFILLADLDDHFRDWWIEKESSEKKK